MNKYLIAITLTITFGTIYGKGIDSNQYERGIPPRIIRTCCAFGDSVGFMGFPFINRSDIIALEDIGTHHYLGGKSEDNGILYTYKGGFIDTGHLRDQSDWTAYLHALIMHKRGNTDFDLVLGREGGQKKLKLSIPKDFTNEDAARLAGRIAYDLSVWHEIATWYGASTVPLVPERYSSFSAEDDYSNQLGVVLGIQSILSNDPFELAMAKNLSNKLKELQVAKTIEESCHAMDLVDGKWWSKEYDLPSKYFLLEHEVSSYNTTFPLLVPELNPEKIKPIPVEIKKVTSTEIPLDHFYTLEFNLNGKLPYVRIFHERKSKRIITSADFKLVLEHISTEIKLLKYRKLKRKKGKKNQWEEI